MVWAFVSGNRATHIRTYVPAAIFVAMRFYKNCQKSDTHVFIAN